MNDIANERVGPMQNPLHLCELIRESMDDVGWNVNETAARLGEHGAGTGGHRLGHRRSLDADAGMLRACAGAPGEGRRRTARAPPMPHRVLKLTEHYS